MDSKKHPFGIINSTLFLIMGVMLLVNFNLHWSKDAWNGVIESDAKGYYAWLPAVFIYQDLQWDFFEKIEKQKYYDVHHYYDYREGWKGKPINKYFAGVAVLELPFFLVAHIWSLASGQEADGFSKSYPLAISLGTLFWLGIGLWYSAKLGEIYEFKPLSISIALLIFTFGTNLFYYALIEPGMSHIYSFCLFAAIAYYFHKWTLNPKDKYVYFVAVLSGLALMVRPVNCIFIFALPFLTGNWKTLISLPAQLKSKKIIIISLLLIILFPCLQSLLFYLETGDYIIYSYGTESFNFADPHFWDILFSYKKGLFLYTPMYGVALILASVIYTYKKDYFRLLSLALFFILITYILSSWWSWWYGGSFSGRPYVDFGIIFLILLMSVLNHLKGIKLYLTSILLIALVALCQIQTYQYRYYLIHWEDMTKEKYWEVFLKIP